MNARSPRSSRASRSDNPLRSGALAGLPPSLLKKAPPAVVALFLLIGAVSYFVSPPSSTTPRTKAEKAAIPSGPGTITRTRTSLDDAIRDRASGLIVESSGVITKTLPDDKDGDRHQRFIVKLDSGNTILIAHNIDLASRVPVREGDSIEFHGQYEWSDQGGTVHWTHHDPGGRREGGWIKHAGKLYD